MREYKIGLYEKALRNSLGWEEKMKCAKECGYDYLEISIDASEEKINRIYMNQSDRKEIVNLMYSTGLPVRSMSVSALTKYALGDSSCETRERALEIIEKSIELAVDLGIRTVMIPGYDIYFGESTFETKRYFSENIIKVSQFAAREGVLLGFETMENDFMNTTLKAVKAVSMVDSPYLQVYPDSGNITNASLLDNHDVCKDLVLGKGKVIALHLKESKPEIFREVPFFTGHVEFERIIKTAWNIGVRRFVTELWDVGQESWKQDIIYANNRMREILDEQCT